MQLVPSSKKNEKEIKVDRPEDEADVVLGGNAVLWLECPVGMGHGLSWAGAKQARLCDTVEEQPQCPFPALGAGQAQACWKAPVRMSWACPRGQLCCAKTDPKSPSGSLAPCATSSRCPQVSGRSLSCG